jgi:hypothetical protein
MYAGAWIDKKPICHVFNVGTSAAEEPVKRSRTRKVLNAEGTGWNTERYEKRIPTNNVIKRLFRFFPAIDVHDHYRQGSLAFREHWKTRKWWHRLYSNIIATLIVDAYFMYKFENQQLLPPGADGRNQLMDFTTFIERLTWEMLHNVEGVPTIVETVEQVRQRRRTQEVERDVPVRTAVIFSP